ncbi:MAG TPA: hypothetical protein VFT72_19090 [Opitutaceae bacterium]|nr:hypothetical protein [Opitutaceae bacterium]
MWRLVAVFVCVGSVALGHPVSEYSLDPYKAVDLPISREVTTITLPAPITAVVAADMLIDNGRTGGADVEEGAPLRFHVTHAPGSNFVLVRSLQPNAAGRLTIIFENSAYVLQLHSVPSDSIASAIFTRPKNSAAVKLAQIPEPVKFTPRIGLSLLDRARAYPVLAQSLPKAVEGVTRREQHRKIELPDLDVEIQEVYRFTREDAVVFLLSLHNKTDAALDIAPSTFAARVGDEKFHQAIANGPRSLAPGETAEAEFAIVGLPDGTRNDLSADNAFTILVNTSRRAVAGTVAVKEEQKS